MKQILLVLVLIANFGFAESMKDKKAEIEEITTPVDEMGKIKLIVTADNILTGNGACNSWFC